MAGRSPAELIDRRLTEYAAKRHGAFSRADAVRMGASRGLIDGRVASARWEVLHPGVYRLAGAPETWRQRCRAACLASGAGAAASHRCAAALRMFWGATEGIVEISVPKGRRVRRSGFIIHELGGLASKDVTVVDAIPVTTPTRTLIDLSTVVEPDVLEEALDDALRRRLTSFQRLERRIADLGSRGRPGLKSLLALIAARRGTSATSESPLETRFLRLLRQTNLPRPDCQYEIHARGRLLARVDFAYPDACLAIEIDGYRWHSGRIKWEADLTRRNALTALGWRVIHVTSTDLEERPDEIVAMIAGPLGAH